MVNIKNANNLCKTMSKSSCNFIAKICAKKSPNQNYVQKISFLPTFSHLSTSFPTNFPSLSLTLIFHYSTDSTTNTTINNLIERSENEN